MTEHLLDANVLIALCSPDHEFHDPAAEWLGSQGKFSLCPLVEGAVVRYLIRLGEAVQVAQEVLRRVRALPNALHWPDDLSYADIDLTGVVGHRQVTDAYLVALASARGGRVATFDRGLVQVRPEAATLVPTGSVGGAR